MGDRRELKIFIYFGKDGTTLARMVKYLPDCGTEELKRGTAKCHPDDKFDPQIGAMIALARMFGDEVEFKSEKDLEEDFHSEVEKKAVLNGYRLVRNELPDDEEKVYRIMLSNGDKGDGMYWNNRYKTFTCTGYMGSSDEYAEDIRNLWMKNANIIAWKPTRRRSDG